MSNVINIKTRKVVEGTGFELVDIIEHSNATGTVMSVLCIDLVTGVTAAFMGVSNVHKTRNENAQHIAKFGSKLSHKDADYHFGIQLNYKYA